MECLTIDSPDGTHNSVAKITYQNDSKALELHLHTLAAGPERIDPVLRLAVNQPYALQVVPRSNLAATGLAVDADGHLIIENYQYVGPQSA